MPYDITTKDGITLRNIPDDVSPDSPQIKARVEKIRGGNFKPVSANPSQPAQQDVSLADRVGNFGRGARAAITAPLIGINQRIGGANSQGISDAWREDMAATGNQAGGTGGQLFGGAAAVAPVAMLPGANSIAGGGLYGLLQGATMPTAEGESPAGNMMAGGAAGAFVPAAIRASKTARAVAVDPFTEAGRTRMAGSVLKRAAGEDAQAVAQRLMAAKGNTPGFTPSVSQAAGNDGISAFERTIRAIDPQAFQAMNQEQKAALVSALSSIAKTPEERAIAVELRDTAAKSLYGKAFASDAMRRDLAAKEAAARAPFVGAAGGLKELPNDLATSGLRDLSQRPMFQSAIQQAKTLAANKGIKLNDPLQSLEGLHYIKLALDDMANPQAASAMGRNAAASVNDMRSLLTAELEKVAPLYGNARSAYADMSKPINQMDIGQELYNRFVPAIADQGGIPFKTGADAFSRALLRNGDQLARNVTGMKGATLSGIMEPDQLALLQGVSKDAGAIAASMAAGRGAGSDTVQKIAMSNIAQEAGIPNWVGNFASVPGGWAKRIGDLLYGNADDQVRQKLAYLMTNPQEAAQAMNAAGVAPSRLSDLLKRGGQWGAMSVPPALQALATE